MSPSAWPKRWTPYFFLAPFLLLFVVFTAYPALKSLVLVFQQTYGPRTSQFIGFENFQFLFTDPRFWRALRNNCVFAVGSILVQLPLSFGLALLLNRPGLWGRTFFRLIFFSPSLVGIVFVAIMFSVIFEKRTGLLNVALHAMFGFDVDFPWLEKYVMAAMIIAALWMYVGYNMIYFLAALRSVNRDLVEAAKVDGASRWQRFWHVTLPAMRPVASFVVLLSLIASFQLFELPFVLFNSSPGPNNQGLTAVMYLYITGFEVGDLGYASTISWVLGLIMVAIVVLQQRLSPAQEE